MGIIGTLVIYALLGLVTATALALREKGSRWHRAGLFAAAVPFWPLFAALLLGRPEPSGNPAGGGPASASTRIRSIQEQMVSALSRLEGAAGELLAPEVARLRGLSEAMVLMERRLAEMDQMLGTPEFREPSARAALQDLRGRGVGDDDPRAQSLHARLRTIERLRSMRGHTSENLERIALKLEEMSSQLQLLRFAGRAEAEVVNLIKEIAQSVSGVSEEVLAGEGAAA